MPTAACEGWQVEVRLYAPIDGAKSYLGELVGLDEEEKNVVIKADGGEKIFPRSAVASLKTHYDFADN